MKLGNSEFRNFTMQGWLRKRVEKIGFFTVENYQKRYFRVDFTKANLTISHSKEETRGSNVKFVPFREVIKVATFSPTYERQ